VRWNRTPQEELAAARIAAVLTILGAVQLAAYLHAAVTSLILKMIPTGGGFVENGDAERLLGQSGGPASPLLDLRFDSPVVQTFSIPSATYQWTMQETSGVYADANGDTDADLTLTGSGLLRGQSCWLWNGTSFAARPCLEEPLDPAANTDYLEAAAATVLDGASSFAFLIAYRFSRTPTAVDAYLANKRQSAGAGWWLRARSGTLSFRVYNGATETATTDLASAAVDGGLHYALAVVDQTAKTIRLHSDHGSTAAVSISGKDELGNAEFFRFGAGNGGETPEGIQVLYMAGFTGDVSGVAATVSGWWKLGSDVTGKLTTNTRASMVSCPIDSSNHYAHYSGLSTIPQMPFVYHAGHDTNTKLGLQCHDVHTNLVTYSERLSANWTHTNITPTANDGDDPAGFRAFDLLTATADNGQSKLLCTTVAATEYTMGVIVKAKTGSVLTGRLIFYDETGAAEIASQPFTADATFQEVTLTATSAAGQVSSSVRVEIDTSGEAIYASYARLNTGPHLHPYLRTDGATATSARTYYRVVNTALAYLDPVAGTVRASGVADGDAATNYAVEWKGGSAAMQIRLLSATAVRMVALSASGSYGWLADNTGLTLNDGFVAVNEWDSASAFNGVYGGRNTVDGVAANPSSHSHPWTPGTTDGTIYVGGNSSGTQILHGSLCRLTIWDYAEAEL